MKSATLLKLSLAFAYVLSGCAHRCDDVDCAAPVFSLDVRLLSAANSSDLLFGAGRKYNPDSLLFFSPIQGSTWEHQYYRGATSGAPADSILQVSIYNFYPVVILRLSDGDTDTLEFTYRTTSISECCGEQRKVMSVRYNGGEERAVNLGDAIILTK